MVKNNFWNKVRKLIRAGGWFPIVVLAVHAFLKSVLQIYLVYNRADIPVHFFGGLSIAFMVSGWYQFLPRSEGKRSRVVILELVLILSLTAVAAVFWEIGEYATDQLLGTTVQVGLPDTMEDLVAGMAGGIVMVLVRSWQLKASFNDFRELFKDLSW